MTATACTRCLSKTVIVFEPELVTKPAWSAMGLGGATAENTGLKLMPSVTESVVLEREPEERCLLPGDGKREIEPYRRVRHDQRDLSTLALQGGLLDREDEPRVTASREAAGGQEPLPSGLRRPDDPSGSTRAGYSAPVAVTADTEAIVNVSLAASGGRGCR